MGEPTATTSPALLDALVGSQRELIESYQSMDPLYHAYVRRHRAGECSGPLMSCQEYHDTLTQLHRLYEQATGNLERRDPDLFATMANLIYGLERALGA